MFRAAAITGKCIAALAAVCVEASKLFSAKFNGLLTVIELIDRCVMNITELIVRVDVVIALVEIAIALQRKGVATLLRENAQPSRLTKPTCESRVEHLHIGCTNVMPHPIVKYDAEKLAILFGIN
jgi:hypothetical protein